MGVGRGHVSPGKKQSNTKRAIREFKKWNDNRFPLYYSNGTNEFIATDDEIFVQLYDYLNQRYDRRYYVSSKGNVISFTFHGIDRPYLMKQAPDERGYMHVGTGWRVHKLVWFSFAADALENGTDFPDFYGIDIKTMKDLNKMARAIKENEKKGVDEGEEIHHIDENPANNSLSNLQCDADKMHDLIHALDKLDNDDERMQKIIDTPDAFVQDNATIIFADAQGVSAHEVDQQELLSHFSDTAKLQLEMYKWQILSYSVIPSILEYIGYDFFGRNFTVDIIKNNLRQRFIVNKVDKGKLEIAIVTDHKLANDEPDVVANLDTGNFDLPQYIID